MDSEQEQRLKAIEKGLNSSSHYNAGWARHTTTRLLTLVREQQRRIGELEQQGSIETF